MNKQKLISDIITSILVYLPTCAFVPIWTFLLLIPVFLFRYKNEMVIELQEGFWGSIKKLDKNFILLIIVALLAAVNRIAHFDETLGFRQLYSYFYLLPVTYIIAKLLNKRVLAIMLGFLLFEIGVGIVEYVKGISSVYDGILNYYEFDVYSLLYNTRVFGLAYNSSIFSEKLFIAMLTLDYLIKKPTKWKNIILFFLLIGLILSFGRAIVLLTMGYLLFRSVMLFVNKEYKDKQSIAFMSISVLFILFFVHDKDFFKQQFTRGNMQVAYTRLKKQEGAKQRKKNGKLMRGEFEELIGVDKIEMSGRREIWEQYIDSIKKHPWFGNGSAKLMFGRYHAHNSYLQTLSSHGIFISLLFFVILLMNINKDNWIIVLGILGLGLIQYIVMWGVSYCDVILYYFLFHLKKT